MNLKREGSRKDGAWKDGQTLVSQVFARNQTRRVERTLFMLASEYGSTSHKDAMTLFPTSGAIVGPNFESGNPFNSGMDYVRALKGQGFNEYGV